MEEVAPVAKKNSPTGNRTRAFHVTGGDTHHYTIEEEMKEERKLGHPRLPRHLLGLEKFSQGRQKGEVKRRATLPPHFLYARAGQKLLRAGFEPATYGCLMCDKLQSTALPTELSKVL